MLRMYLLQVWFSLSDEGIEDSIYDSFAMRQFMHINFLTEQVPDATTLLKFRHLLEKEKIGEKLFEDVKDQLDHAGLIMHGGTVVDATLISAPSSTKNEDGKRDPEMHQTRVVFWHESPCGVDAGTGFVHTITGTSANVHDSAETAKLIREDDTVVYGDSGYLGVAQHEEIKNDPHLSAIDFRINRRPSSIKLQDGTLGINWDKYIESRKSSVRAKVEHPFLIVKRQFAYFKVAYREIVKNMNRFHVLFASVNLVICIRGGRTEEFCNA